MADKRWHLAESDEEFILTEFEFLLWRTFHAFSHWQQMCQSFACGDDLDPLEIALLHLVQMQDRPKAVHELGRLLNRDDLYNLSYKVKKLIKLNLVKETTTGKNKHYEITAKGRKNTQQYTDAKRELLVKLVGQPELLKRLEQATRVMVDLNGIYAEAARMASLHSKQ